MEDNHKMAKTQKDPRDVAIILLKATAQPDKRIYTDLAEPKYTTVDYYPHGLPSSFPCASSAASAALPATPLDFGQMIRPF